MSAENLGQIPAPSGSLSTFSNSKASLYGEEIVKFPFRVNIPILPNPKPDESFAAFTLPITSMLQKTFFDAFEYYTFEALTLDLQCTAPLGTASGAIQVGYFSDPLNAGIPTTLAEAKTKIGSTDGWVMIRPRDSKALQIPVDVNPMLPGWRFVREDTANIRMSSFGTVVGITAEPPAIGDGTVYEGWLHGWAVGKRRTQQTGSVAAYMRFKTNWGLQAFEWDYVTNCPFIAFQTDVPIAVPAQDAAQLLFDEVISAPIKVTGKDQAGVVLSATIQIDFACIAAKIFDASYANIRFTFPQLAELGFVSEGLVAKEIDAIIKRLNAVAATVMYRPSTVQLNPDSFNQARFMPKFASRIQVFNTTKQRSECVISGRAVTGESDQFHSAFGVYA